MAVSYTNNAGTAIWDIRGDSADRPAWTVANQERIPNGSTWLNIDGGDTYIWQGSTKTWLPF